jgi:hypothetical protein
LTSVYGLLFPGLECQTARFANMAGLKNGELLDAAEAAGFAIWSRWCLPRLPRFVQSGAAS